jgi:hypothetical protein
MTTIGWIIAGFFWAGMGICGVWGGLLAMEAGNQVNKLRPPDKQFPILFGNFAEREVRREYRRLFPDSQLYRRANRLAVLLFVSLFMMALTLHFFHTQQSTKGCR